MEPFDPDFEPYRRLLARQPRRRPLPVFERSWLDREPRTELTDEQIEGLLVGPANRPLARPALWLAAAAVLVAALGFGAVWTGSGAGAQLLALFDADHDAASPADADERAVVVYTEGDVRVLSPADLEGAAPNGEGAGEARELAAVLHGPEAEELWRTRGRKLQAGSVVERGEWLRAGSGASADLALANGIVIRLSESSLANLARAGGAGDLRAYEIYLDKGRLLSVVERLDQGEEYSVSTPTAIAGVRGTSFRVSAGGAGSEVYVVRGAVEVAPRSSAGFPRNADATLDAGAQIVEQNQLARIPEGGAVALGVSEDDTFQDERELDQLSRRIARVEPDVLATLGVEETVHQARRERRRQYSQIILKNGEVVEGQIVSQVGRKMFIETEAESRILYSDEVSEVRFLQDFEAESDSGGEKSPENAAD